MDTVTADVLAPNETALLIHRTSVANVAHVEVFWRDSAGLHRSELDTDPYGLVVNLHAQGCTVRPLDEATEGVLHAIHERTAW